MKYEVKKNGKIYMVATDPRATYPPEVERSLQRTGFEIYVDGKKKRRVCCNEKD